MKKAKHDNSSHTLAAGTDGTDGTDGTGTDGIGTEGTKKAKNKKRTIPIGKQITVEGVEDDEDDDSIISLGLSDEEAKIEHKQKSSKQDSSQSPNRRQSK